MEKQHDTILFDMDGTLFDTERLYHAGWNYAGVPDDVYRQMIGRNPEEIRELLLRYPELGNPDEIRAEKEKYTNSLLEKEIPMKPYLLETLQWLKANGYRCCIATSSAVETAERYLKKTNTAAYIEKIISGRNLAHSKPSPDIYLLAAKEMGVSPSKSCSRHEDRHDSGRVSARRRDSLSCRRDSAPARRVAAVPADDKRDAQSFLSPVPPKKSSEHTTRFLPRCLALYMAVSALLIIFS